MFLATSVALFGWMMVAGERVLSTVVRAGPGALDERHKKDGENKDKTSAVDQGKKRDSKRDQVAPLTTDGDEKQKEIDKYRLSQGVGVDHHDDKKGEEKVKVLSRLGGDKDNNEKDDLRLAA
jgi:hypothetical protein